MGLFLYRLVILIPLCIFLFGIFVWIPFYLLRGALQSLIGRPLGFGWERVDAEVREQNRQDNLTEGKMVIPGTLVLPDFQYAVYRYEGEEYQIPLARKYKKAHCTVYVQRENPLNVWVPNYPDVLSALIGTAFVLALWGVLIWAAYVFAKKMWG